ncbi:MAG: hypothetical protein ACE3JK_10495 [Sporolactobacillus sp.]
MTYPMIHLSDRWSALENSENPPFMVGRGGTMNLNLLQEQMKKDLKRLRKRQQEAQKKAENNARDTKETIEHSIYFGIANELESEIRMLELYLEVYFDEKVEKSLYQAATFQKMSNLTSVPF